MEYDEYLSGLPTLDENNDSIKFTVREGRLEEANLIGKIINKAFVEGDAWFKKAENHVRFDREGKRMAQILSDRENSRILVAETDDDNKYLIGAVLLDWKDTVGHWGALSCPYIYSGRGVGTKLVQTSINFFKSMENVKKIEITVLSTKNERLVAWYEQKGLKKIDGEYDFVAPKIVLDEYNGKIKMISMEMPCV